MNENEKEVAKENVRVGKAGESENGGRGGEGTDRREENERRD